MRIIGGDWRGRRLAEIGRGDEAARLRPTPDRVREAIFNLLQNGGFGAVLKGARVLDLFAGSGALGLEALSRGAAEARFIDNGRVAARLIGENIRLCGCSDRASLLRLDATAPGPAQGAPATLVFLDPPYGQGLGAPSLTALRDGGWLAPGALVVWEESARQTAPAAFRPLDARRYGGTWVTVLESA